MAARYWIGGGTNANWNASPSTNWAATSGGVVRVAAPTSTDDVFFDSGGNSNSTISAIITVQSLTIGVGYTATITHSAILTVGGNVTLHSGYTIAGSSSLTVNNTAIFTSGSKTWPNALTISFTGTKVFTVSGDLRITGLFTLAGATAGILTIDKTTAEKIECGGFATSGGATSMSGTITKIVLKGGNMSTTNNLNNLILTFEIDGTVTHTGTFLAIGSTFNYASGTFTSTGTMTFGTITSYLNIPSMTWTTWSAGNTGTCLIVLGYNTTVGTLTNNASTNILAINSTVSETVTVTAALTAVSAIAGTAKIIFTGGTWTGSSGNYISNNLDLQGNIIISGNVYYGSGTLTYVSGTITVTSSTLNLSGGTYVTTGLTWNNVSLSNASLITYTFNSTLLVSNTLTLGIGSVVTFAGSAGFTTATLSIPATSAITINFKESITYTISTLINAYASGIGSIVLLTSSHATTKAKITLTNGGTCKCLSDFTRVDASGGRPIRSFNATITDCINIEAITDLKTMGKSS